jgi:hypothetical protein
MLVELTTWTQRRTLETSGIVSVTHEVMLLTLILRASIISTFIFQQEILSVAVGSYGLRR